MVVKSIWFIRPCWCISVYIWPRDIYIRILWWRHLGQSSRHKFIKLKCTDCGHFVHLAHVAVNKFKHVDKQHVFPSHHCYMDICRRPLSHSWPSTCTRIWGTCCPMSRMKKTQRVFIISCCLHQGNFCQKLHAILLLTPSRRIDY